MRNASLLHRNTRIASTRHRVRSCELVEEGEKNERPTPPQRLVLPSETRISLRDIGANKWRHSSEKPLPLNNADNPDVRFSSVKTSGSSSSRICQSRSVFASVAVRDRPVEAENTLEKRSTRSVLFSPSSRTDELTHERTAGIDDYFLTSRDAHPSPDFISSISIKRQ